jgi:CDP-glucose 4,6-dehydratase
VAIRSRPLETVVSMTSFADFYRNKRVLVTGHTGFKGTWLCLWLSELGAEVHGYSAPPSTTPSLFEEVHANTTLASHQLGDIRDSTFLTRVVRIVRPEIVFHLAAQPLVRLSYRRPRETYEVNVMGTVNLLEAVREVPGVRVAQIITSDKCYENADQVRPFRETDRMGGSDPYSSSKGCAELVVSAYRHAFFPPCDCGRHGVSLSSVRAGNVIGGGDWAEDRLVPDCIRSLQRGEPVEMRNPKSVRPWQHVLEALCGYLRLAMRQWHDPAAFASGWNLGPLASDNVTVRELVTEIIHHWGESTPSLCDPAQAARAPDATSPREAKMLRLDITKATSLLGWQPVWTVSEAVAATVAWYRERWHGGDSFNTAQFCRQQIRAYVRRAESRSSLGGDAQQRAGLPLARNANA